MNEFINAFKNTSYYQNLFIDRDIVAIYILGSRSIGILDEQSDYDIDVIIRDGADFDPSIIEYLKYKDKKVHWYFKPLTSLFTARLMDVKGFLCPMQLRHLREELIIYENPKYKDLLQRIKDIKDELSVLGAYNFYNAQLKYINDILSANEVTEQHYSKMLYHLCWASYYLVQESPDKKFLSSIKRIKWRPVPEEYKAKAVERLRIYQKFITEHHRNIKEELQLLYNYVINEPKGE